MTRAWDQQRWLVVGALLAPLVVVQGGRVLLGGGPQSASAASAAPAPAPELATEPQPARRAFSEAQRQAWAQAQRLGERPTPLESPMDAMPANPVRAEAPAPVATVKPEAKPLPPRVALTTVLKGARGTLAVINGTVYARGDEVAPGWIISVIDAEQLRVELLGPQNTRCVIERGR